MDLNLNLDKFKKPEPVNRPGYHYYRKTDYQQKAHKAFKRMKAGLTVTEDDWFLIHMFYPFMREAQASGTD